MVVAYELIQIIFHKRHSINYFLGNFGLIDNRLPNFLNSFSKFWTGNTIAHKSADIVYNSRYIELNRNGPTFDVLQNSSNSFKFHISQFMMSHLQY